MTPDVFVQLRDISRRFGRVEALRAVRLDVMRDELLVVLGPTGAGKTTLLRTIAGIEAPGPGSITINGIDVTNAPPAERDVAMVFQNFSLYPHKTVRQNLEFPLLAPGRNLAPDEIPRRIEWAARLLKISPLLDRPATTLSGGEMQRVAIGRAIVRRPRIFLMDEPLSNLDAKLREALRVELVVLRRELKAAMIFVTHDQLEAMSMGDRIAVLNEGRILQIGAPEEIYRNPVSPVVARQLGQPPMNLLPVRWKDGQLVNEQGQAVCAINIPQTSAPQVLGIRPEDIEPSGGEQSGRVLVVEDTGPACVLLVRWLGFDIHILAPRRLTARAGDDIFPRINPDRATVWPRENHSC